MIKSEQMILQEVADRFKRLENSFAELKTEIKTQLKEISDGY